MVILQIHPMDNNLGITKHNRAAAIKICKANQEQVRLCDIIVANCNPFRGICMDDGTAYELGFGNALGKISYGYISKFTNLGERTAADYVCVKHESGMYIDKEGYLTDDFPTAINLMMEGGMELSGGRLVEGDFETCLIAIRQDIDSGKLVL